MEPSVPDCVRGLFRVVPVTGNDRFAFNEDLSCLPGVQIRACLIDDPDLGAHGFAAGGGQAPGLCLGPVDDMVVADQERRLQGLGQPVALGEAAAQPLDGPLQHGYRHGAAAVKHQPQRG